MSDDLKVETEALVKQAKTKWMELGFVGDAQQRTDAHLTGKQHLG